MVGIELGKDVGIFEKVMEGSTDGKPVGLLLGFKVGEIEGNCDGS